MANTTFYERGNAYHDSAGNPAIIKNGNELTFTEHFNAGGGADLAPATANTLGGVMVGNGLNVASDGTLSVAGVDYSTDEVNTGRKWLDNKPIYEKTILLENVTITANQGIVVGDNFGIDKTINASLRVESENGTASIGVWINGSNQIVFQSPTSYAQGDVYVTIQYTKTTSAEPNANTRTTKKTVKRG